MDTSSFGEAIDSILEDSSSAYGNENHRFQYKPLAVVGRENSLSRLGTLSIVDSLNSSRDQSFKVYGRSTYYKGDNEPFITALAFVPNDVSEWTAMYGDDISLIEELEDGVREFSDEGTNIFLQVPITHKLEETLKSFKMGGLLKESSLELSLGRDDYQRGKKALVSSLREDIYTFPSILPSGDYVVTKGVQTYFDANELLSETEFDLQASGYQIVDVDPVAYKGESLAVLHYGKLFSRVILFS